MQQFTHSASQLCAMQARTETMAHVAGRICAL